MACRSHRRHKGFTLFEMLLGLAVAVPLVYGATLFAVAIIRASVDERVSATFISPLDGRSRTIRVYRNIDSSLEADAVSYHAALSNKISKASATYVFGAENIGADLELIPSTSAVQEGSLAASSWVTLEVDNTQRTAREFAEAYGRFFDGVLPAREPGNFSVVVTGTLPSGKIGVIAIAQVICAAAKIAGKGEALPDATLQQAQLWTAEGTFEYSWVMPARRDADQNWKPRADQYWLRVDDVSGLYEPGLAICRFPDPFAVTDTEDAGVKGTARFVYVL